MKQLFKRTAFLVLLAAILPGISFGAAEKTKKFYKSWPATGIETVNIVNKFGEVKVVDKGGSQITIDVVVTVEAGSDSKANELLDMIDVSFQKKGKTVFAQTNIENNFSSNRRFSIDYLVNVPADKNLEIANKYGNTLVNRLFGSGYFDIQYGNLTANQLKAPVSKSMEINLEYGKAAVAEANNLLIYTKYSALTLDELTDLKMISKYSTLAAGRGNSFQIESKYDKLNFDEVEALTVSTKYTHINVGKLGKSLNIDAGYGSVKVDKVAPDFESITVTNAYGQIALGLGQASYFVDASCKYCGISYPESNFSGQRVKESNTESIRGNVGTGGGKIMLQSRYGEIKLRD